MSNRKKLFLEIASMFLIAVSSSWLVSLGDDKPSGYIERPLHCFGIALLLSIIGGYGLHRFKLWDAARSIKNK